MSTVTTIVGQVHGPRNVLGETGDPHTTFELGRMQPTGIPLCVAHWATANPVGRLDYLERADNGALWAVGSVDDDVTVDHLAPYWSAQVTGIHTRAVHGDHIDNATIGHVAFVHNPATRVHAWRTTPASLEDAPRPLRWPEYELDLLERAASHHAQRRRRRSWDWQLIYEAPPNRHLEKIHDAEEARFAERQAFIHRVKLAQQAAYRQGAGRPALQSLKSGGHGPERRFIHSYADARWQVR